MRRHSNPIHAAVALLAAVLVVGLVNIGGGQAAPYGEPVSVIIPGSLVRAQQGTTVPIGTFDIPVGECSGKLTVINGPSVHDDNSLTVSTNGTSITASDIEGSSGKVTEVSGTLVSNGTLTVVVFIGNTDAYDNGVIDPDTGQPYPPGTGTYSGGGDLIELECTPPSNPTPPPTTAPSPPVTTAPPPTSSPPSSSTTTTVTKSTTATTTTISSTSVPPPSGSSSTSTTVAATLPPTR